MNVVAERIRAALEAAHLDVDGTTQLNRSLRGLLADAASELDRLDTFTNSKVSATARAAARSTGQVCEWCGKDGFHTETCHGFTVNDPAYRVARATTPKDGK